VCAVRTEPIDEAVLDDIDLVDMKLLPDIFSALRPGGRLDVSCMDFDSWVVDYHAAVQKKDEDEKTRLVGLLDGRRPLWQYRLNSILYNLGFERMERLPVRKLHMIAFKPNAKE
jgi:hypothetical protein